MKTYTEAAVRRLRANIYGECSDINWNACKHWSALDGTERGWMVVPRNIRWLLAHQPLGS